MEAIKQTQKKYGTRAMTLAIVLALGLIIMGEKAAGKGLVLGALFSVINFVLIGSTLPQTVGREKRTAIFISFASLLLRYTLLAIPLILAIKLDQFNIITVIVGIFMIQLIILLDRLPIPLGQKRASS
jgi:predicted lysophospholipase L1 biosynthesis ABC-type transport system permease subunit